MSLRDDDLFVEEAEFAQQEAASEPKRKGSGSKAPQKGAQMSTQKSSGPARGGAPLSFGRVVAIALVALALGIGIGYFIGMAVTGGPATQRSTQGTPSAISTSGGSSTATSTDGSAMPEGHPDLSQFMNEDGTVNQEAVEAFRAANG